MSEPAVIAIAHRGASAYAPENTVAAFDEAVRMGAGGVAFDVRMTRDGVPVVLHDATVDRTTSGKGPVNAYDRFDLLRLDAGSWFHRRFAGTRIPTLEEALVAVGSAALPVIELKAAVPPGLLLKLLEKHAAVDDAVVISREQAVLRAVRMHTPRIALGVIAEEWTGGLIEAAQGLDASYLVMATGALGPERIADAGAAGLEVWAWTANDVGMVAACAAVGVTGIMTDRPDLIRHKQG